MIQIDELVCGASCGFFVRRLGRKYFLWRTFVRSLWKGRPGIKDATPHLEPKSVPVVEREKKRKNTRYDTAIYRMCEKRGLPSRPFFFCETFSFT